MTDLASELLRALALAVELAGTGDPNTLRSLLAQLDRVEAAMAAAVDDAFGNGDDELEQVA